MGTASGESTETFGGFGPTARTFWCKATELRIGRSWLREGLIDDAPKFDFDIGGKARSEDKVVIIGETKSTTDFSFHLNADDPAESWTRIKSMLIVAEPLDESTPERKMRKYIYEQLDEAPPTATLFWVEADRETGIEEGWVIECTIPREVLDQLFQDLLAGKANEISVGIRWVAGFVRDRHAPPSFPNTWGLFRTEADSSPEPLNGQVESLTWELRLPHVGGPDIADQEE